MSAGRDFELRNPPRGQPKGDRYTTHTSACQYCVVGCGYRIHLWAPGQGTPSPPEDLKNLWMSPSWSAPVHRKGQERVAAVVPDPQCSLNRGNHSVRGGTMGRNLTFSQEQPESEEDSTRERITTPMLRLGNGQWAAMDWEEAMDLMTSLVGAATCQGSVPRRLGVKMYGYHSLENTFAATRLFWSVIGTPNLAQHDRPSSADSSPGISDATIHHHSFCYDDLLDCDAVFLLGSNAYECQSVMFQQAIAGRQIVVLDPRRTITADYAARTGGIHLQPNRLGADCLILGAIARLLLKEHWGEKELGALRRLVPPGKVEEFRKSDKAGERQRRRILDFEDYRRQLLKCEDYRPSAVAELTGIALEDLRRTAAILAEGGKRTAILYEKGLIWGYNWQNTAAVANLAVLTFNINAPNRAGKDGLSALDEILKGLDRKRGFCGRLGGHQKGWAQPKDVEKSLERTDECIQPDGKGGYDSWTISHFQDYHLCGKAALDPEAERPPESQAPYIRFGHPEALNGSENPEDISLFWVIGCNPAGQMSDAQAKWKRVEERLKVRREGSPSTKKEAKQSLIRRVTAPPEGGPLGLVIIQQDIYPNYSTEFADILLPARAWGENAFTRYNGERRLRLYEKFQDPPRYHGPQGLEETRCRSDWRIFQDLACRLIDSRSYKTHSPVEKTDWASSADVFEALAAPDASNRSKWLKGLRQSVDGPLHDELKSRGSNGVFLPTRLDCDGKLEEVQTIPHPSTECGPGPFFVDCRWGDVCPHFKSLQPRRNEVWIANGRVNETWNSMSSNIRNSFVRQRYPDNLAGTVLEVNPSWAESQGLSDGDLVEVKGRRGEFLAVLSRQESVPPGGAFALFSYPVNRAVEGFPLRRFEGSGYANNLTSGYVDPSGPIAAFKYGRATVRLHRKSAEGVQGLPTYAQRHRAIDGQPFEEGDRQRWMAREILVSRGLPRASILARDKKGIPVISGGTHGAFWRTTHDSAAKFLSVPLMGQFPLIATDGKGRPVAGRSLLIQILSGDSDTPLPRMPLRSLPLPHGQLQRLKEWIDQGCSEEGFEEIQVILDHSIRIHARLFGPQGRHPAAVETLLKDPDLGIDLLAPRGDWFLQLIRPGGDNAPPSPMCWRGQEGQLISQWTEREFEIMEGFLSNLSPGKVRFRDVQRILDRAVQGAEVTALHGKFWNRLERDEFIRHRVLFAGGEIPLIRPLDGANSPLVLALRGRGPFSSFRMPVARDAVSQEDIQRIEEWINHGCP